MKVKRAFLVASATFSVLALTMYLSPQQKATDTPEPAFLMVADGCQKCGKEAHFIDADSGEGWCSQHWYEKTFGISPNLER